MTNHETKYIPSLISKKTPESQTSKVWLETGRSWSNQGAGFAGPLVAPLTSRLLPYLLTFSSQDFFEMRDEKVHLFIHASGPYYPNMARWELEVIFSFVYIR